MAEPPLFNISFLSFSCHGDAVWQDGDVTFKTSASPGEGGRGKLSQRALELATAASHAELQRLQRAPTESQTPAPTGSLTAAPTESKTSAGDAVDFRAAEFTNGCHLRMTELPASAMTVLPTSEST